MVITGGVGVGMSCFAYFLSQRLNNALLFNARDSIMTDKEIADSTRISHLDPSLIDTMSLNSVAYFSYNTIIIDGLVGIDNQPDSLERLS
ncbi:hypothetical protein MNBD_GAMMA12-2911 [hydrothermal vent metagenome]|uniref:Uncharacterized protein n=1 Tax=hydrothermal vent metagenome TaxID=652676 RepID=A0A3B0Z950_9ZZZZ